jgi:hypothetical protein
MLQPTIPDCSVFVSTDASSGFPRRTGEQCVVTPSEAELLRVLRAQCERRFDQSRFFTQLASGAITTAALGYVLGQYGHYLDALLNEHEIRPTEAVRETAECVLRTEGCALDRKNVSSQAGLSTSRGELVNAP